MEVTIRVGSVEYVLNWENTSVFRFWAAPHIDHMYHKTETGQVALFNCSDILNTLTQYHFTTIYTETPTSWDLQAYELYCEQIAHAAADHLDDELDHIGDQPTGE